MSFLSSLSFALPSLDTLLSLPALSFLLVPTLGGYTTTLNILFFYMTWTTLVLSHSPVNVEMWGTIAVRVFFYVLPSSAFFAFDLAIPSLSQTIKAQGKHSLPARTRWLKIAQIAGFSVFNVVTGAVLQAAIEYLLTEAGFRSAVKVTIRIPMPWAVAKDLTKGFILRGVLQYYLHRYALHDQRSFLAPMHLSWHHSIRAPYSFVANYDHPLAWLVGRWLPVYLPAFVFRFHLLSYFLMLSLVSLEETFAFSGYSVLPSTIVLRGLARRHEAHMLSRGQGNFGPWGFMDWICGTVVGEDVIDDVRNEMEKHDVQGKAKKTASRAANRISRALSRSDGGSEDDYDQSNEVSPDDGGRPKRSNRRVGTRKAKR